MLPLPRWQQARKNWTLGHIHPCQSIAIIGGREAKTTRATIVHQQARATKVTTSMEDVMATLG